MRRILFPTLGVICVLLAGHAVHAGDKGDKEEPMKVEKAPLGDRDDAVLQNKRFLKIRNDTKDTVTVYLQYRALDKAGGWAWVPADPATSSEALSFSLKPGEEFSPKADDMPVAASRMRIAVTSPTQKWMKYRDKDCWLVPEKNDDGEHVYLAEAVDTFTFVISNNADTGAIPPDSDAVGEQGLPTEGTDLPVLPPDIPWDVVDDDGIPGGGFPFVRDLAVLPVKVMGPNAVIRVKNLGHKSKNIGRRLFVRKLVPGALPQDAGPIGPLFHFGVKQFFLVGLAPGDYVAFVTPGDDPPFHLNDKRNFTISAASFADLTILPASVMGGNVTLKVKNIGTAGSVPGQRLKIMKLPGGIPVDHGPVGALAVNANKTFGPIALAPGAYRAFIDAGDASPHDGNDTRLFAVAAGAFSDLDVLPAIVVGGNVTIKVKNVGTAPSAAGPHLKVKKLPAGVPVDHGPIGGLAVGGVKTFGPFPLGPGNYRAFVDPGDPAPHNGNDAENFAVLAPSPDLEVSFPAKVGATVKGTVKNNGPGPYAAGPRQWHIEKLSMGMWNPIPTIGSHVIPNLAPGATHAIQGTFTGNGMYRIRITPGDSTPGNDVKTKMLP